MPEQQDRRLDAVGVADGTDVPPPADTPDPVTVVEPVQTPVQHTLPVPSVTTAKKRANVTQAAVEGTASDTGWSSEGSIFTSAYDGDCATDGDVSGQADVTEAVNTFIAAAEDGSTIRFDPGCYRVNGTIRISDKTNLTVNGKDAIFKADSDNYKGIETRKRAHWKIENGTGITINGVEVVGSNDKAGVNGPYLYSKEGQHGFSIIGGTTINLSGVSVRNVWGDFVSIRDDADGVWVNGSSIFSGSGRQGVAIVSARNVHITGNRFDGVRRTMFDLEPNTAGEGKTNVDVIDTVDITDNKIGTWHNDTLSVGPDGLRVDNVTFKDNTAIGKVSIRLRVYKAKKNARKDFTIDHNTSEATSPNSFIVADKVQHMTVSNNTQAFNSSAKVAVKAGGGSCDVDVPKEPGKDNIFGSLKLLDPVSAQKGCP